MYSFSGYLVLKSTTERKCSFKMLSRKVKLLWPQIVFLILMHDIFVKVKRGENGKYSDMMLAAGVY